MEYLVLDEFYLDVFENASLHCFWKMTRSIVKWLKASNLAYTEVSDIFVTLFGFSQTSSRIHQLDMAKKLH